MRKSRESEQNRRFKFPQQEEQTGSTKRSEEKSVKGEEKYRCFAKKGASSAGLGLSPRGLVRGVI
jgi:hypothetical protein